MRAAVAARKPGLAGTAAFRRGAAQRGKVGRAAAVRGRRSRGTGALAGRGGSAGGFFFWAPWLGAEGQAAAAMESLLLEFLGVHGRWSAELLRSGAKGEQGLAAMNRGAAAGAMDVDLAEVDPRSFCAQGGKNRGEGTLCRAP
ncbi:hypothetical protein Zm00014a_031461 [Zea mays]|uniref:Uncharacterized protein n=2 Tax=Zea mays TaxID=4577 RepID=A0A3L6EDU4_MAIZE|nr:hypothetical protein Zm00014a_031462 [Zea mays]PWZ19192.1 hypothetical protein Zm00014a_031461 [Zea mays]